MKDHKKQENNKKNDGPETQKGDEQKTGNANWDLAQRRNQAGPRGYDDNSGIIKGQKENGMERMKEKDPQDQTELNKNDKEDKS